MTFDSLSDLNWLAVLVAALAYFAIGAVWYAPPAVREGVGRRGRHGDPGGGRPAEPGDLPHTARRERALRDRARDAGRGDGHRHAAARHRARTGRRDRLKVAISFVTAQFESQKPKPMVWERSTPATTSWATWSPRSSSRPGSEPGGAHGPGDRDPQPSARALLRTPARASSSAVRTSRPFGRLSYDSPSPRRPYGGRRDRTRRAEPRRRAEIAVGCVPS